MDKTPPNQCSRVSRTPTPKMSERKKALFGKLSTSLPETIDEDSDLGPMSPLQFSSSPTHYEPINDIHGRFSTGGYIRHGGEVRRDFRNIINEISSPTKTPASHPTSPRQSPMQSSSLTNTKPPVENIYTVSLTPLFGKENSDQQPLSDVLRTPSESIASHSEFPRVSFRKSLIFDTNITPESGTVDASHLSPNTRKCVQKRLTDLDDTSPQVESSKARASLTFTAPGISAKTFYGSSFNSTTVKNKTITPPAPIRSNKRHHRVSSSAPTNRNNKRASIQRPVLGSSGGGIRRKTIAKPTKTTSKTKMKSMSKSQILEAAIHLIGKKKPTSSSSSPNTISKNDITRAQIERLQHILKGRGDSFELSSRPFNWTGTNNKSTAADDSMFDESDVEEAQDSVLDASDQSPKEGTKRKFFKSKYSTTQSVYRISNSMSVSVKRGAALKLLSPKRKKQRCSKNDCK